MVGLRRGNEPTTEERAKGLRQQCLMRLSIIKEKNKEVEDE